MSASARFVVVGGGVVAASVAYHLVRRGASVIIVEGGQRGTATSAGAGIICPWTAPLDDACYRLCAEGAAYYPELLAMLAEDGEADSGYARVGALCVAGLAQALQPMAALLESRRTRAPGIGEVAALAPSAPARMFPPLAPGLAGLWIGGGARVNGRAMPGLSAARCGGPRRPPGTWNRHAEPGRRPGARSDGGRRPDRRGRRGGRRRCLDGRGMRAAGHPVAGRPATRPDRARPPARHRYRRVAGRAVRPGRPYLIAFPAGRIVLGATREQSGFAYHATVGGVGGLLAGAVGLAPGLRQAELLETRIGFRPVTSDGRPLLGLLAGGLIVATGHGPEGLTAGPWSGLAVALLALGQPPVTDLAPFDPSRFQA